MPESKEMEKSLTKKLRGNFSSAEIKEFSGIIAHLQMGGLKVDDAFPEGIVSPDSVVIKGDLLNDEIVKLADLIKSQPNIREIKVFPRGIPVQERWRVHLTLSKS